MLAQRPRIVQAARLRAELDKGPEMHGWTEARRWTLERVTTLIGRLFHVRYTLRGTSYLLHRLGNTPIRTARPTCGMPLTSTSPPLSPTRRKASPTSHQFWPANAGQNGPGRGGQ